MSFQSDIEWTEATWNPVTGCTKISKGCKNCYAERLAMRLHAMGNPSYKNGFNITLHDHLLSIPLKWNKPRVIFVNSMSDLFHESIPLEFIKRVFGVMATARQHVFQVLTKRAERLCVLAPEIRWPKNVWMGVTVESNEYVHRLDLLREVPAAIRFVSFEPLLSEIANVDLREISWAIVGGESGPGARVMRPEWATSLRDQCLQANVAFFFKQWGGFRKKQAGRKLEGKLWNQMPTEIRAAIA